MTTTNVLDAIETPDRMARAWRLGATGYPGRALAAALAVHEAARRAGDSRLLADSADCLADCCIKTAQYELGISFARTALGLWQAAGQQARAAGALSRLAELLSDIGDPDSLTQADQALTRADHAGDAAERVRALQSMGVVLSMMKQPDRAVPFCERAVALARETGTSFPVAILNLAEVIFNAGVLARQRGDPAAVPAAVARALPLIHETLAQARAAGDGWLERLALNNMAGYCLAIGDTAGADAALAQVPHAPGEPTARCQSHHLLIQGQALMAQGRLAEAVEAFQSCSDVLLATDYLEVGVLCFESLAEALEKLGAYREALAAYRRFHEIHVRQASEAAQRRARVYAMQQEMAALQAAATQSQILAATLAASNEALARETERLRRTSLEDPLTGLPNRRRLDMGLSALAEGSAGYAIAIIDVDHFKQVNDRFSHQVGDEVLREIGRLLTANARALDMLVRYGGEEFALLMPETDGAQAIAACERLRRAVQHHDWACIRPGLALTVSIGLATSEEARTHEAAMVKADARLYAAKHAGRNRVIAA